MTIGKVTLNQINPTPAVTADSTATSNSKNIQNQITTKEQHLDRLSSDDKLSAAEKEKKRREIQKEIDELNRKLELMRMRKEEAEKAAEAKQQKAEALKDEQVSSEQVRKELFEKESAEKVQPEKQNEKQPAATSSTTEKEEPVQVNMPIEDVQKMLTADYTLQKELAQKHVETKIESTINVLEAEIKQDKQQGVDTSSKEAEIEAIETKQNFWTEEAKKQQTTEQREAQAQTNRITGMNVQAKLNIDTI